jgi:hypothetical protein
MLTTAILQGASRSYPTIPRLGFILDASLYKIAHRNLLESLIVLGGAARHIGTHGQAG